MAVAETQLVELHNDFYRDSFGKVIILLSIVWLSIIVITGMSIYLYLHDKPPPVAFPVYENFRVQQDVAIDQPYLSQSDLLQWVSDVLPNAFNYDFINYQDQLKNNTQYFTTNGWKVFLNQLNNYVNYSKVQSGRLFVTGAPVAAPYLLNQGLLSQRYAWWVQIPIRINYVSYNKNPYSQTLNLQVLVVRVPTLNNLSGVGIENVILAKNTGSQTQ